MAIVDLIASTLHLLFAGLWTGSVLFVAYAVLPTALAGEIDAAPLSSLVGKLTTVSRTSAVVLFLTGGHMAATRYTADSLTGTGQGHLVLAMLALWFVLAALVEIGASKLRDGTADRRVRSPARDAANLFRAAALVAVLLLVDAGLLAGGVA